MWRRHFQGSLRDTANSISVAGSTAGAIIAPPLVAWLALSFNWHAAFLVPGALGLAVAVIWWFVYREPESANPVTIRKVGHDPTVVPISGDRFSWPALWRTRTLWVLLLIRFITDPAWYFCLFWLPGYSRKRLRPHAAPNWYVRLDPFSRGHLGGIGTAAWSDRMVKRGTVPLRARKLCYARSRGSLRFAR